MFLYACNEDTEPSKSVEANSKMENLIAQIDLGAKGYVDFVETEPGEIIVDATIASPEILPDDELTPVALYEYVSGEAAPEQLVAAYHKVEQGLGSDDVQNRDEDLLAGAIIDTKHESIGAKLDISASEFQRRFCPGRFTGNKVPDYGYCLLNRTNTTKITRGNCYSMYTYASPYRGTIRHRLRYKSGGKWVVFRDKNVLQGYWSYIAQYGSKRGRESTVFEAAGDGYHHTVFGNN